MSGMSPAPFRKVERFSTQGAQSSDTKKAQASNGLIGLQKKTLLKVFLFIPFANMYIFFPY